MHELSIAMSIVEMAEEESERHGWARVSAVHLKLGPLSGVVKDALLASFEMACEGTVLAGSALRIKEVPIVAHCVVCNQPREVESLQWFVCPVCASPVSKVLQGREMEVVALEIEEVEACP